MTTLSVPRTGSYYIYSFDGRLLAEYDIYGACLRDYIYMGSRLIAEYVPAPGQYFYYTRDQIGSTRIVTNDSGTVVYAEAHDPYGGIQKTWVNTFDPKRKFSDKERDAETGLDYFGARYYSAPTISEGHTQGNYRWISVDPVIDNNGSIMNPQLWNLYSYCKNSPISIIDPDGRVIEYESEEIRMFVERLAKRSKKVKQTLEKYDGDDEPHLLIKSGNPGQFRGTGCDGSFSSKGKGDYNGHEKEVTEGKTSAELLKLGTQTVTKATITLNLELSLSINDRRSVGAILHELGHADDAARDYGEFSRLSQITTNKDGKPLDHDQLPLEKMANNYMAKVLRGFRW